MHSLSSKTQTYRKVIVPDYCSWGARPNLPSHLHPGSGGGFNLCSDATKMEQCKMAFMEK